MLVIETFLALGADDAEDTWLERASGLTGDELSENLPRYVPEAEGQDIPPSAVSQYLGQQYGDTAMLLCDQWQDVHDEMVWFEGYNEENDLWPEDNEDDNAYKERLDSHFKALTEEDETAGKGNAFNQIWDNTGIVAVTSYAAAAPSYYQRDMTPIPRMIVDESDIVTYLTDDNGKPILDEKGNQKKNIDFKTYEYYPAVKCNRPEVGEIGDWQDGVSDYKNPEH